MNVATVHYHLNRGGVTRVIENQFSSLDAVFDGNDPLRVALLFGGRRLGWREGLADRLESVRPTLHTVPRLEYDDAQAAGTPGTCEELHGQLTAALEQLGFTPPQTVVHVHNHSLGKNRHLPRAVARLAEDGYGVLLQVHDFAEDFRADNYRKIDTVAELYPQAANIHYAVLNGRDRDVLQKAGVEPQRLHLLPNPVPDRAHLPSKADARARLQQRFGVRPDDCLALYPVRCIRRKNIGEALLYSALAPKGTVIGLTLAPLNPAELEIYRVWKELAEELHLPCRFELGGPDGLTFAENLAAADVILTTSLAEGFGMVYLESWLAGLPLIGRDLPEITSDFVDAGLRLDWQRPQLYVPLAWVGAERFCQTFAESYRRTLASYDRAPREDSADALTAKTKAGQVDFGDLDETMQQEVIRAVCRQEPNRREVFRCNPWLDEALAVRADTAANVIEHNTAAIRRHYSRLTSGRRLVELYRKVLAGPRTGRSQSLADGEAILDRFLRLERFRPIRG